MDVLETTQQSRQVDGASMDIGMLRQKDEEIARLKEELAALRANSSSNANEVNEQQKQDAVKSMVYSVKKNRQHRKSHVTQMQTLASQLENSIASGDHAQMSSLVESLKNAIQAGEKANSKMDREMVNMIDFSSAYFNPQVAGSGANIDELVAENQRLRQKLEKRHHCKKCGYKRGGKNEETSHASGVADGNKN
jgi:CRISPR/Cas system-associated exonuclease Cas4 (RecB family)